MIEGMTKAANAGPDASGFKGMSGAMGERALFCEAIPPVMYEVRHAPAGGWSGGGKSFVGGQFIPSDVFDKASPDEKAKLEGEPKGRLERAGQRAAATAAIPGKVSRAISGAPVPLEKPLHPDLRNMISDFVANAPDDVQKELHQHLTQTLTGKVGDFISKASPEELHQLNQHISENVSMPGGFRAPQDVTIGGRHFKKGHYIPPRFMRDATPDEKRRVVGPGWGEIAGKTLLGGLHTAAELDPSGLLGKGLEKSGLKDPFQPEDKRGWWQRNAPKALGGKDEPTESEFSKSIGKFPAKKAAVVAGLLGSLAGAYMLRKHVQGGGSVMGLFGKKPKMGTAGTQGPASSGALTPSASAPSSGAFAPPIRPPNVGAPPARHAPADISVQGGRYTGGLIGGGAGTATAAMPPTKRTPVMTTPPLPEPIPVPKGGVGVKYPTRMSPEGSSATLRGFAESESPTMYLAPPMPAK